MEPDILSLPRDQFMAALGELQLDPAREADLVRQYREANSPFAPIYGLLSRIGGQDAEAGMQRADILPVMRPEGMSVAEAIRSGDVQFAVPQGLIEMVGGAARGVDAPAAAAQGLIPADDMIGEAMGTAGVAMGAGGSMARPEGSVGMGGRVARDFDVSRRDASNIFGEGSERVRYTDPQSGGTMEIVVRPNGQASVLELEVPEEFRGQGIGQSLQARVMQDFPVMGGQVSSKAAATTAYRLGRRPYGQPDATLEDVFRMIDEDSSVNLISPAAQPTDLSANRSTTTGLLAAAASDTPAQRVARLLREGRADEVTDDLMAQADPQEMFRLYQAGETGMDLPMDEASRMVRAREMGFDTGTPLYHGTGADFRAFQTRPGVLGDAAYFARLRHPSFQQEPIEMANSYANRRSGGTREVGGEGANIIQAFSEPSTPVRMIAQGLGEIPEGAVASDLRGPARAVFDPTRIRSRFARFDPRLSHLANLNAANVDPLTGLLAIMQAQEPRQ